MDPNLPNVLAGAGALVVSVITTTLVFHPDYEDGLFGRVALSFISLAAVARVTQLIQDGIDVPVSSIGVLLWCSLACFLARHFYRFLKWKCRGTHDWRRADVASTAGKARR